MNKDLSNIVAHVGGLWRATRLWTRSGQIGSSQLTADKKNYVKRIGANQARGCWGCTCGNIAARVGELWRAMRLWTQFEQTHRCELAGQGSRAVNVHS